MARGDFYEDDEPVEKLVAKFNRGDKVVTAPPEPGWGQTMFVSSDQPQHPHELSSTGAGQAVTVH